MDELGYRVDRSADGANGWTQIADVPWDITNFTDAELAPASHWYYRVRAYNSAGEALASSLTGGITLTAYGGWKVDRGLSANVADTDDSDHDGIPLLIEYALNLDPAHADSSMALPVSGMNGEYLTLTFTKVRANVSYLVEASTDLQNWTTAGVNQGGASGSVIAFTPLGSDGQKFLRLHVTAP